MDCDASAIIDSAGDVPLSQADHLSHAPFIALGHGAGAGPGRPPASVKEDRAADVSRSQEDRCLRAGFIGQNQGMSSRGGSVVAAPAPHPHSTAAPIAGQPDGSPSGTRPGLARLRKRAVAEVGVPPAGAKKTRGVRIGSTETPAGAQQEEGSGGQPSRPGEEGKKQEEDGDGDPGLGEGGQGEPQQEEGNGDLGLGKGGELPRAAGEEEEDETQPVDVVAILDADRQQRKLPSSIVKGGEAEKKAESGSCSTKVPSGGSVRPPRNLREAINMLVGEPSGRFAGMNVLDILKMKGIDLTPPPRYRRPDGGR